MFHGHLDYFEKQLLGGTPNTKPWDHGTPNTHNHWFILFFHVWGPTWIEIHRNSIWLRARSHMTSHYNWGSMTTLHDSGGVLGQPLDTLFGLSQFHRHGSWLVSEVALRNRHYWIFIFIFYYDIKIWIHAPLPWSTLPKHQFVLA